MYNSILLCFRLASTYSVSINSSRRSLLFLHTSTVCPALGIPFLKVSFPSIIWTFLVVIFVSWHLFYKNFDNSCGAFNFSSFNIRFWGHYSSISFNQFSFSLYQFLNSFTRFNFHFVGSSLVFPPKTYSSQEFPFWTLIQLSWDPSEQYTFVPE